MENLKTTPPRQKAMKCPFFVQIIISISSLLSGKTSGVTSIPKKHILSLKNKDEGNMLHGVTITAAITHYCYAIIVI